MARRLRVLVIDDIPEQAESLDTSHLELMRVPAFDAEPGNDDDLDYALSSWTQHLWLWFSNNFAADDADLVLIDCRFEEDVTAPSLGGGQDPRGLLHGAIYISRMFGRDRFHPFGFAGYSQDASGFRGNPFAQTFMGYLLAMREATIPEGQPGVLRGKDEFEIADVCNEVLVRTINQYPATAWSAALRMYRQRLAESFGVGAYVVDTHSWKACYDAIVRHDGEVIDGGLSLSWRRFGGQPDAVTLCSLFADTLKGDRWAEGSQEVALEWFDSFPVLGDCHGEALEWADAANDPDIEPEHRPEIPRGKGRHGETYTTFFHATASVCAWLVNRMDPSPNLPSGIIVRELDLSAKQVDRYFKRLIGRSWGNVVAELDRGTETMVWPFPELWELRRVVEDWARIRKIEFPFTR